MYEELVVKKLQQNSLKVALAESCTGGMISASITSISGSSQCFECGVVAYSNEVKNKVLGVPLDVVEKFGAVSYQTALGMAKGVRNLVKSDIGISVTGIAGPQGGNDIKPVGLVYIALATEDFSLCQKYYFKGNREEIRKETVKQALKMVIQYGI